MRPVDALFPRQAAAQAMGICPFCGLAIGPSDFRDPISLREFAISGLCQKCQDEIFSDPFGD